MPTRKIRVKIEDLIKVCENKSSTTEYGVLFKLVSSDGMEFKQGYYTDKLPESSQERRRVIESLDRCIERTLKHCNVKKLTSLVGREVVANAIGRGQNTQISLP